jgi:hypothetical protein
MDGLEATFLGILIATFIAIGILSTYVVYKLYAGQR